MVSGTVTPARAKVATRPAPQWSLQPITAVGKRSLASSTRAAAAPSSSPKATGMTSIRPRGGGAVGRQPERATSTGDVGVHGGHYSHP
jgi:hypothetical protein